MWWREQRSGLVSTVTFRRTFGKALVLDLADIAEPADPIYGDMALVSPLRVQRDLTRVWRRRIDCPSAGPELCHIWQYMWESAGSCRRAADTGGEDLEEVACTSCAHLQICISTMLHTKAVSFRNSDYALPEDAVLLCAPMLSTRMSLNDLAGPIRTSGRSMMEPILPVAYPKEAMPRRSAGTRPSKKSLNSSSPAVYLDRRIYVAAIQPWSHT
jgi:hypothetical protein